MSNKEADPSIPTAASYHTNTKKVWNNTVYVEDET